MKETTEADWNPGYLLEVWWHFIEGCEEGYQWDYGEYLNEIDVRDTIHCYRKKYFNKDFEEELLELDNRFRALLIPNEEIKKFDTWWKKGVLKFAGDNYAHTMKCAGFDVELK